MPNSSQAQRWLSHPIMDTPASASAARAAVRQWLVAAGSDARHLNDIELVVSELVTNVLVHGRTPAELAVLAVNGTVRLEVRDADPHAPRLNEHPTEAGGYGLRIVEGIADRWGWEPTAGDGKLVWAEVPRG